MVNIVNRSKIPLTLNKGFSMPAWFDMGSLQENVPENESDILRAVDRIHELIDEELARTRLPSRKLLLGGFSQGGALAMYAAFTYHKPLAGLVLLSCWIPLHKSFPDVSVKSNQKSFKYSELFSSYSLNAVLSYRT